MGSSIRNALLVIANLFVSLAVAQAVTVATFYVLGIIIAIPLQYVFGVSGLDAILPVLLLAMIVAAASFLVSSWTFASHFARNDRRGHLAVVWGIPTLVIVLFLVWFIGTVPRR